MCWFCVHCGLTPSAPKLFHPHSNLTKLKSSQQGCGQAHISLTPKTAGIVLDTLQLDEAEVVPAMLRPSPLCPDPNGVELVLAK